MGWTEEQYREYIDNLKSRGAVSVLKEAPKLAKIPRPRMNRWEEAYGAELLVKQAAGEIEWFGFEPIKLRLADATFYTPDFAVIQGGRLCFIEIKGFIRDDAMVKFKVAAEMFPFMFLMLRKIRQSDGGGWEVIKRIDGAARRIA